MNRKDTIIIAVLINAGLLAVLFMLAINTDEDKISDQSEMSKTIVENQIAATPQQNIPLQTVPFDSADIDEVDNFLKDLALADHSQSTFVDDEGPAEFDAETPASPKSQENVKGPLPEIRIVEITVKRGDALEKIARSNGTTVDAIKKSNNLSSSKLTVGQVLKVPVSDKGVPVQVTAPPKASVNMISNTPKIAESKTPPSAEPQYYTVKSGDNPWKIAKQFQVKFDDLLKLNGLDEEKARNLKVGDKIRVR